jgi:hypothetical protein
LSLTMLARVLHCSALHYKLVVRMGVLVCFYVCGVDDQSLGSVSARINLKTSIFQYVFIHVLHNHSILCFFNDMSLVILLEQCT